MSSVGDLTVNVKCDVSELTAGMEESRQQLALTTTNIEVQDATWKALASSVVQAAASIAPAVARIAEVSTGLAGTIVTYRAWGPAIAAVAQPVASLGSAFLRFGGIAATAVGFLVPQWKLVTTAISASLLVYKVATSDIAAESYKAVVGTASVSESTDRLSTALGKLGEAASAPFGQVSAGAESLLQSINPLPFIFGTLEAAAAASVDTLTAGVEYVTPLVTEFGDVAQTAVFVTSSWGQATAETTQNFYEQTKALRDLAAETERINALQEAQQPLFQNLGAMQAAATAAAEHSAEVRRLGSIKTIDDLNAELIALQQKAAQEVLTGKATEESQKKTAELFAAIANQREQILAGNVKPEESPVEKSLEAARKALFALEYGQDAAAVAALRAAGATDEQVAALEKLQEATARINEEKKAEKAAEDELMAAAKKAEAENQKWADDMAANFQKGEDRIAALKDQLDLASGAATKADIAMREALAAGFTDEQAQEIKDLTQQLDDLEKGKKKTTDKEIGGVAAQELGSTAAFSSIFASMRGNDNDVQKKALAVSEKQLTVQEEMVAALENFDIGVELVAGSLA